MKKSKIVECIKNAIKEGRLKEPFRAKDVREACPELNTGTIPRFLWKHSDKGGVPITYFKWVERGLYKLK